MNSTLVRTVQTPDTTQNFDDSGKNRWKTESSFIQSI